MRILVLLSLLSIALLTQRTANHHSTPPPHASVLHTTAYALDAGVLTNVACAVGAYAMGYVPVGMETEACVPWSVAAGALTARIHVFSVGGWGKEERAYAWELGQKALSWLFGGPERWFETFDGTKSVGVAEPAEPAEA
ncbi:uncharacterized protein DNG_05917 [Cephalotrichum gorgonifer]|uniref:Uncharacterized protein n=1 Tax=Cephalotrichum gorgonifer TaxID=2041049 RepID=A0AAE8N1M1_9PEZI|nr:uncharacterized protein DNG_05917 [Cephalotrichum gorgonifer]